MKLIPKNLILLFCTLFPYFIIAQDREEYTDYYFLRRRYDGLSENDARALPFINKFISESKKDKNNNQLFQGYRDALQYSPDRHQKLKYGDSLILVADQVKDLNMQRIAHLEKGVVYYFQFKNYQSALDEYLKAFQCLSESSDPYGRYKLIYLIGVVKSYIGYYDEAIVDLETTKNYFSEELNKKIHPNLLHNNQRGYYNSLHQLVVCFRNIKNFKAADLLIKEGLIHIGSNKEYRQESGYFLKEKGISEFRKQEYDKAIESLTSSLAPMEAVNDFAWIAVVYSYLGKSHLGRSDQEKAIEYFQKVDSIFVKHGFIIPEIRDSYEILINYYKERNEIEKQLYYTTQLLKADKKISTDFVYLSKKIEGEYDTKKLLNEKEKLEKRLSGSISLNLIFGFLSFLFIAAFFYWKRIVLERHKNSYGQLETSVSHDNFDSAELAEGKKEYSKMDIDKKIVNEILLKLQTFEANKGFTENGLTLQKLAVKFDTNSNYLSQIINEHKGATFTRYLSVLRITYITSKLENDKKYLNYKIETLAEECGIASRSNFSNLFQEINGMRPAEFIKKRMDEEDTNN